MFIFFLMIGGPPRYTLTYTLFPYTTLSRSGPDGRRPLDHGHLRAALHEFGGGGEAGDAGADDGDAQGASSRAHGSGAPVRGRSPPRGRPPRREIGRAHV